MGTRLGLLYSLNTLGGVAGSLMTVTGVIFSLTMLVVSHASAQLGPRRPGDVIAVYADNCKARALLDWDIKYNLEQMMDTAWRWELALKKEAVTLPVK